MKLFKIKPLLASIAITLSSPVSANIIIADNAFESADYQTAITEYKAAAQAGNARALHTLGVIYNQGLGVEPDKIMAISWMALAAQYNYKNAKQVANSLLKSLLPTQKPKLIQQVQLLEPQYGLQSVKRKVQPRLLTDNLTTKVTFIDEGDFHILDSEDDLLGDVFALDDFNDDFDTNADDEFFDSSELSSRNIDGSTKRPYFLVADLSIAHDGTVRDVEIIQQYGAISPAIRKLKQTKHAKPSFNGKAIPFYQRVYLGLAQQHLSKMDLQFDYKSIYRAIRPIINKQQASNLTPSDKYLYALVLMSFEGIKREPNQIETLLSEAAEAGLSEAQYVLGTKMYRDQIDIKQAIEWITKAAKNGLANAEYFVGELCLTSPWVEVDDQKAHFWLDRAAQQGHITGLKRAAYVKLHATDTELKDVKTALTYLEALRKVDKSDPEILYLLALAYDQQDKRRRAEAVGMIRNAIFRGQQLGWDTQEWQDTLTHWTTGGTVIITDETY